MSLSLFNAVPAGAIEVIDSDNKPHFMRADLGRFLGIVDIRATYRDVKTTSRELLIPHASDACLPKGKNIQDAFVDLDSALDIVVRSKKPKAIELTKWLVHKGVEKIIEEKDMQLALLNDDLTESQDLVRQLEYNNTGLQGEIRAKDQEIERRIDEVADLRERYVDHCRDPGKDNMVIITRKHTCKYNDDRFEYPYYISRIQRRTISAKRRWLREKFPDSEEIVAIDNPNSIHKFNRLEEEHHLERYGCHFKLIDLTREDLYDMGIPAAE